ncbi:MAG: HNH endonuclease [SAR324 cluster bacterium]|nr:HNH endonuclease [SAR324 cluster bacterium]
MRVYVKSKSGTWLMPTHAAKARFLLKRGKAKVFQRTPFTIQLQYDSPEIVQPVTVGIDDGGIHVGVAAVAGEKVLYQEEINLRTDIRGKMDTRRSYRSSRRNRNTRYRKPRFLNRVKNQVLAPSIKSKKDAIVRTVLKLPLPTPSLIRLEDAYFDFQAIENPAISGNGYQEGALLYEKNFKTATKTRDGHKCRVCKTEANLQVHHLQPRSVGGTDKLSNLMTLCLECHRRHHQEGLRLPKQKSAFYVFASHVQQGKQYLQSELRKIAPLQTTFGYITSHFRKKAGLDKSHVHDAVMIANREARPLEEYLKTNCVESRKRSLHEATARKGRKEPNREAKRNAKNTFRLKGFQRWDTVKVFGQTGFISGFTGSNACRVVNINGEYIQKPGKSYNNVNLSEVQRLWTNQSRVSALVRVA